MNLKENSIKIKIDKRVEKDLKKIPKQDINKIFEAIDKLKENPFLGDILKSDLSDFRRIKLNKYRIAYIYEENVLTILIIKIGHRKDFYEKLKRIH